MKSNESYIQVCDLLTRYQCQETQRETSSLFWLLDTMNGKVMNYIPIIDPNRKGRHPYQTISWLLLLVRIRNVIQHNPTEQSADYESHRPPVSKMNRFYKLGYANANSSQTNALRAYLVKAIPSILHIWKVFFFTQCGIQPDTMIKRVKTNYRHRQIFSVVKRV